MRQLFVLLTICFATSAFAQQRFISSGKIEFEKKENTHKSLDMLAEQWGEEESSWIADWKKRTPQFAVNYFDLYFNEDKSLFKPGRENTDQREGNGLESVSNENVIFTNLKTGLYTAQKNIFGTVFLINDSARAVEWRITSETREIAGFECHKAVGKLLDSIYVVAFYTDQILATSGPELFNGLPGMILGLAIPRLNTTWFATKLEVIPVTDAMLTVPTKGKKNTAAAFSKTLVDLSKDWGKFGRRRILQAIL